MSIPINGVAHDWSSVEVHMAEAVWPCLQSIDYEQPLSRKLGYGAYAQPVYRTQGQLAPKCSVKMIKSEFTELIRSLGDGYMNREFEILVQYQATPDAEIITDEILKCCIGNHKDSVSQGGEAAMVDVEISTMLIRPAGLNPVDKMIAL